LAVKNEVETQQRQLTVWKDRQLFTLVL